MPTRKAAVPQEEEMFISKLVRHFRGLVVRPAMQGYFDRLPWLANYLPWWYEKALISVDFRLITPPSIDDRVKTLERTLGQNQELSGVLEKSNRNFLGHTRLYLSNQEGDLIRRVKPKEITLDVLIALGPKAEQVRYLIEVYSFDTDFDSGTSIKIHKFPKDKGVSEVIDEVLKDRRRAREIYVKEQEKNVGKEVNEFTE